MTTPDMFISDIKVMVYQVSIHFIQLNILTLCCFSSLLISEKDSNMMLFLPKWPSLRGKDDNIAPICGLLRYHVEIESSDHMLRSHDFDPCCIIKLQKLKQQRHKSLHLP